MAVTTYEYYVNNFYGDVIDEAHFLKWANKAFGKVQYICSGRLTDAVIKAYNTEVQDAVCSVAEALYKLDYAETYATDTEKGNIKSMSSGGQSVTFGDNTTIYSKILNDKKAQDRLFFDLTKDFLGGTGLMYLGD